MTIAISWKNIWRNKLRSIIIIMAIAIGIFGGIFAKSFFVGMAYQRVDATIKNQSANLQIHNPKFLMDEAIDNGMPNTSLILDKLKNVEGVKGISTRLTEMGMAGTAEANAGIIVNGIHPDTEKQVTQIFEKIQKGYYLQSKDLIGIVIGHKLSEKLNADIGDKIVLSLADKQGEIVYGAFKVKGIYNTSNHMFDGVHVFVNYKDLKGLLKTPEDYYTEIAISLVNNDLTAFCKRDISNILKTDIQNQQLVVRDWAEIEPTLRLMVESIDYFAWFFIVIILIALAFGIINTMVMVVMERTPELGMLMAIGMNKRRVFSMILWETVFLSFVGALVGMFVSISILQYFIYAGLDLSLFGEGMNAFGFDTVIYPKVEWGFYIQVGVLVFITAIISSIFPARYALKLQPANAIRE